ncbi:MAG: S8 family serine peptidase, partial [Jatrophihabitantaceae bacterium]
GPQVSAVAPADNLVNEELNSTLNGPYPDNDGTSSAAAFVSGFFALLRSRFPQWHARQIVSRALYHDHNGLGAGHEGERINDNLDYGEILPYYALTEPTPDEAKNPSSSSSNTGTIIAIIAAAGIVHGLLALMLLRRGRGPSAFGPSGPGSYGGGPSGGGNRAEGPRHRSGSLLVHRLACRPQI